MDPLVSIVIGGVEAATKVQTDRQTGKVPRGDVDALTDRLTPLVQRMKQGPASIFMELGENSGDALFELSQTYIDFNAMMRYSFLKLEEWFEKAGSASSNLVGGIRRGTI